MSSSTQLWSPLGEAGPSTPSNTNFNYRRSSSVYSRSISGRTMGLRTSTLADELFGEALDDDVPPVPELPIQPQGSVVEPCVPPLNLWKGKGKAVDADTTAQDVFDDVDLDEDLDVTPELAQGPKPRQNSFDFCISTFRGLEEKEDAAKATRAAVILPTGPPAPSPPPPRPPREPVPPWIPVLQVTLGNYVPSVHGVQNNEAKIEEIELGLYPNAVGAERNETGAPSGLIRVKRTKKGTKASCMSWSDRLYGWSCWITGSPY